LAADWAVGTALEADDPDLGRHLVGAAGLEPAMIWSAESRTEN